MKKLVLISDRPYAAKALRNFRAANRDIARLVHTRMVGAEARMIDSMFNSDDHHYSGGLAAMVMKPKPKPPMKPKGGKC